MSSIAQTVLDIINKNNSASIPTLKQYTGLSEVQLYNVLFYLDKTKKIQMIKAGWESTGKSLLPRSGNKKRTIVSIAEGKSFSDEATEILLKHFGASAAKLLESKIVPIFEKKIEELTSNLANKFADQLEQRTSDIIASIMKRTERVLETSVGEQEAQPPTAMEQKVVKKKLLKVCVLGLKPNQQGSIAADFGQSFNLVFWNEHTGSSFTQLNQMKDNCDAFFIHTNHIGHNAQEILKGCKIVYCGGGVTHMKEKLREYYEANVAVK